MLKINDEVELTCLGVNNYAKGIAKLDSLMIFVDDFYPGEVALIKITSMKKNLAFGVIKKLIKKAPFRIDSTCQHGSDAGTCPFSDITYEEESLIKKDMVMNNLRYALKMNIQDLKYFGSPIIEGYRNKVTVFFSCLSNEYHFGYFKENSHDFIAVQDCVQIDKDILQAINSLLSILKEHQVPLFDYNKNEGLVRGASIRKSWADSSLNLLIIVTHDDPIFKTISEELVLKNHMIKGISLSMTTKTDTIVYSGKERLLFGSSSLVEIILGKKFIIDNASFLQVNTKGCEILYQKAMELANLKETDSVLDLYCGVGGISLNVAPFVKEVIGLELSHNAVKLAKKNALLNNIKTAKFFAVDAAKYTQFIQDKKINKVFIDPPRMGLSKEVLDNLLKNKFEEIIYISCEPYTLSRDLKELTKIYSVDDIVAVDMFPRTKHVETIVLLQRETL